MRNIYLSRSLLDEAIEDLLRPHLFVYERVGFFRGFKTDDGIYLESWYSLSDDDYERPENPMYGTVVSRSGLHKVFQDALITEKCYVHFHLHSLQKIPKFSLVDEEFLSVLPEKLFDFSFNGPHGALVMGTEGFCSHILIERNGMPVNLNTLITEV